MLAMSCRPPAARSRLNPPGKTGCPVGEAMSRPFVYETPGRPEVALAPVGASLARCGCVGIWSPRW